MELSEPAAGCVAVPTTPVTLDESNRELEYSEKR
jgi:hypothetical protein